MVLEVAVLEVVAGQEDAFHAAFAEAQTIISSMPGYIDHRLARCMETPNRHVLLVNWETLVDHTEGFRGSPDYLRWKALLHHFYDPFPQVEHYETVFTHQAK
jgi:heme-degrading monooxygenase HmoA